MGERVYVMKKQFHEIEAQFHKIEVQLDAYRRAFRNLMAVIDRDGGHAQTGDPEFDGKRGEGAVVELRATLEDVNIFLRALAPDSPSLTVWTDSMGRVMVRRGKEGPAAMGYNICNGAVRDELADALTRLVGVFAKDPVGQAIMEEE